MDALTPRADDAVGRHSIRHVADRQGQSALLAWLCRHEICRNNPVCAALAPAAAILLASHLRFDAADPHWPDRDRLVVSERLKPLGGLIDGLAGAAQDFAIVLPDPPGQALGAALGLAMAERHLAARFGRSLVDHRTWLFASRDDLATGMAQEAAQAAAALRLGRLTVLAAVPDAAQAAPGFGANWTIRRVDSGDAFALHAAISAATRSHKPTLIACAGIPAEAYEAARQAPSPAAIGGRGAGARRAWLRRVARHAAREEFERTVGTRMPPGWHSVFSEPGPLLPPGQSSIAPLATSRHAFGRLAQVMPELVMLAPEADGRDHAKGVAGQAGFAWQSNVQALACAAGGMARHGGVIPVGQLRLSDAESLAPALRSAAQAGLRVVHIVAEPALACPTAGHRAGLRAMRNVFVFRPADAAETLECAELALRRIHGPSVLLLSEVACAPLTERPTRTRCVHGGFLVHEPAGRRDATLIASGAELAPTLRAHAILAARGIVTAVVSLPCWELFANQEPAWRDQVLGPAPRIAVEAGSGFGWERWLGPRGSFVGTDAGTIDADRIVLAVTK